MKKLFCVILAVLMLTGVASVLAETVAVEASPVEFDVSLVIPEGFTLQEERVNNTLYVNVWPDDLTTYPLYTMTIAFSEEYEGTTISEMTEEEQQSLVAKLSEENFWNPTIAEHTTTGGTLVYVLDENDGESDYAMAFTVYRGYFIQMFIEHDDYAELSETDIQQAIDLLSGMEFTDK